MVFSNLRNAFPYKSEQEIRHIAKQFYIHLCDIIVETVALLSNGKNKIKKRVTYRNPEVIYDLYQKGKHICLITGHYGNWEWICSFPLWFEHKGIALYQPLKNPYFNKLISGIRIKFGAELIPKRQGVKQILKSQDRSTLTASLFIGDQTPQKYDIQYWTTFLNQKTPIYTGIEKIARKSNQAVAFLNIQKKKRGYYEIEIIKITENAGKTKPYEITEAHVRILERVIKEKPQFWLWSHRRWKHTKTH